MRRTVWLEKVIELRRTSERFSQPRRIMRLRATLFARPTKKDKLPPYEACVGADPRNDRASSILLLNTQSRRREHAAESNAAAAFPSTAGNCKGLWTRSAQNDPRISGVRLELFQKRPINSLTNGSRHGDYNPSTSKLKKRTGIDFGARLL
jgi:hypothetical protein